MVRPAVEDSFSPRTVAIVALSSLVGGFVAVFGGWMLLHRGPAPTPPPAAVAEPAAPAAPPPPAPAPAAPDAAVVTDEDAGAAEPAAAALPSGDAGVGLGAISVSRCWAAASPVMIPGARCDRLTGLETHLASRAAAIAACATGHGRLSLILDFRVSTNFARAWGGPSSTIANAGVVAACVRRVTSPLPITTMPHQYDRYIVNVPVEW
jgi:hypothetical protein